MGVTSDGGSVYARRRAAPAHLLSSQLVGRAPLMLPPLVLRVRVPLSNPGFNSSCVPAGPLRALSGTCLRWHNLLGFGQLAADLLGSSQLKREVDGQTLPWAAAPAAASTIRHSAHAMQYVGCVGHAEMQAGLCEVACTVGMGLAATWRCHPRLTCISRRALRA